MRIVGIYREPECSPGRHLSNDALLLEQIGRELQALGADVTLLPSDEALTRRPDAALVFSMCQSPQALAALQEWERQGATIVNSPASALNTYRDHLPALLSAAGVPFPETRLIDTVGADATAIALDEPHWLKRGDVHASVSADVQRIASRKALDAGLADFRARGIHRAALQQHRDGVEVKFYGVSGGFFHWFRSNEPATGAIAADAVSTPALQHLGARAARAAGLDVYGGDIIIEPSGALTLIDLNDWPSFAPCRDAASAAIADFLMRRVHAAWNTGLVSSANESAL
jgi:glutathione synthase/RimK-type ligase-like ATP-grasp enzyme